MTNLAEIITLFALILQFVQGKKKQTQNQIKTSIRIRNKKNEIHRNRSLARRCDY